MLHHKVTLLMLCFSVLKISAIEDDGQYVPDDSGSYIPDDSGKYIHQDVKYIHEQIDPLKYVHQQVDPLKYIHDESKYVDKDGVYLHVDSDKYKYGHGVSGNTKQSDAGSIAIYAFKDASSYKDNKAGGSYKVSGQFSQTGSAGYAAGGAGKYVQDNGGSFVHVSEKHKTTGTTYGDSGATGAKKYIIQIHEQNLNGANGAANAFGIGKTQTTVDSAKSVYFTKPSTTVTQIQTDIASDIPTYFSAGSVSSSAGLKSAGNANLGLAKAFGTGTAGGQYAFTTSGKYSKTGATGGQYAVGTGYDKSGEYTYDGSGEYQHDGSGKYLQGGTGKYAISGLTSNAVSGAGKYAQDNSGSYLLLSEKHKTSGTTYGDSGATGTKKFIINIHEQNLDGAKSAANVFGVGKTQTTVDSSKSIYYTKPTTTITQVQTGVVSDIPAYFSAGSVSSTTGLKNAGKLNLGLTKTFETGKASGQYAYSTGTGATSGQYATGAGYDKSGEYVYDGSGEYHGDSTGKYTGIGGQYKHSTSLASGVSNSQQKYASGSQYAHTSGNTNAAEISLIGLKKQYDNDKEYTLFHPGFVNQQKTSVKGEGTGVYSVDSAKYSGSSVSSGASGFAELSGRFGSSLTGTTSSVQDTCSNSRYANNKQTCLKLKATCLSNTGSGSCNCTNKDDYCNQLVGSLMAALYELNALKY